jgi:hypothetical protein
VVHHVVDDDAHALPHAWQAAVARDLLKLRVIVDAVAEAGLNDQLDALI